MSVKTIYKIACDDCHAENQNGEEGTSITKARSVARAVGWATVKRNGKTIDLCPRCKRKQKVTV
jgi:hypothetical protein